jgi:hypothetical protein
MSTPPSPRAMFGAGRGRTVIKLMDNCPGYQNKASPKGVIATFAPTTRGCNTCFSVDIAYLTVHTGQGNPGAIGIYAVSNNGGGISNVDVVSGDKQGAVGIDMRIESCLSGLLATMEKMQSAECLEDLLLLLRTSCGPF